MQIKVILFGPARDAIGANAVSVALEDHATVADLADRMAALYPQYAGALPSVRFAINDAFVPQQQALADGDEVALIPPVSGGAGADSVALAEDPLDAAAIRAHLDRAPLAECGGVSIFEGRTRLENDARHGLLVALDYEAYGSMALKQMGALVEEARQRWAIGAVVLVHRVGRVPVGEPSIIIGVACGHREESFAVCRWLIDTLKKDVPIWKKEIWQSGESSWVDPTAGAAAE